MKGPFGIVVAAGVTVLIVAIFIAIAPSFGGTIEEQTETVLTNSASASLLNNTAVLVDHRGIGDVVVSNQSGFGYIMDEATDYDVDNDAGTVTLTNTSSFANGTYYLRYESTSWSNDLNTDLQDGGEWFGANTTWVTLTFLGIVASIIIALFLRW